MCVYCSLRNPPDERGAHLSKRSLRVTCQQRQCIKHHRCRVQGGFGGRNRSSAKYSVRLNRSPSTPSASISSSFGGRVIWIARRSIRPSRETLPLPSVSTYTYYTAKSNKCKHRASASTLAKSSLNTLNSSSLNVTPSTAVCT